MQDDLGKTTGSEGEEVCDLLEDSANPVPVPKLQENDAEDDESLETPKALRALRSALNRLALEDSD